MAAHGYTFEDEREFYEWVIPFFDERAVGAYAGAESWQDVRSDELRLAVIEATCELSLRPVLGRVREREEGEAINANLPRYERIRELLSLTEIMPVGRS